ncbi:MAG: hypothetical protein R6U17_09640 [Thermoplasmata archaeon]
MYNIMSAISNVISSEVVLQEEVAFGLAGGLCFVVFILPLIIWIAIGIWMYKDAKKRGENAVLWLIVGLIAGLIGLIIWMVIRPDMAEVEQKKRQEEMGMGGGYYQEQPPPQQQYQQQPPPSQQPPPQQPGQSCPDCGSNMRYIDEYNRWYCDNCQGYK